jgi:hypothetical protein
MRCGRLRLGVLLIALTALLSDCGQKWPLTARDVFVAFGAATLRPNTITPMSFELQTSFGSYGSPTGGEPYH